MRYAVRCMNDRCTLQDPARYDDGRLASWLKEAHEQNTGHRVEILEGPLAVQSSVEPSTGSSIGDRPHA